MGIVSPELLVEGVHGEAKARHGLARAIRRGLWNMRIQAWLTAAAINLKRLAKAALRQIIHGKRPNQRCWRILDRLCHRIIDIHEVQRLTLKIA